MPPLRPVDYRTLTRVFERDGFAFNRQHGDHLIYTKAGVKRPLVIPTYKELPVFIIKKPPPYGRDEPRTVLRPPQELLAFALQEPPVGSLKESGWRRLAMETYYHPGDLAKFAEVGTGNKELWEKFQTYYAAVFADGALTEREKALIALGVAHALQCPYCIDAYSQACLEKGSNIEEMTEAVHVACALRGGASLVHGVQMRKVVEKLSM
jgi:4-carboxymuconolactone decarboxylase